MKVTAIPFHASCKLWRLEVARLLRAERFETMWYESRFGRFLFWGFSVVILVFYKWLCRWACTDDEGALMRTCASSIEWWWMIHLCPLCSFYMYYLVLLSQSKIPFNRFMSLFLFLPVPSLASLYFLFVPVKEYEVVVDEEKVGCCCCCAFDFVVSWR